MLAMGRACAVMQVALMQLFHLPRSYWLQIHFGQCVQNAVLLFNKLTVCELCVW
jgi:hypothetical protein